MTRKSRRELEKALKELGSDGTAAPEITSTVTTVTEEDVDEHGNVESAVTRDDVPEEYDLVVEHSVPSDAVDLLEFRTLAGEESE
jgi:hypothetical protein